MGGPAGFANCGFAGALLDAPRNLKRSEADDGCIPNRAKTNRAARMALKPRARGGTALITVTYNSAAVLPDFLASLSAQTADGWARIAIDNASADDTVAQLEAWTGPRHAIMSNGENLGFARGCNQGI